MDDIDKLVKTLNSKLTTEQTRYQNNLLLFWNNFSIKMNTQSSLFYKPLIYFERIKPLCQTMDINNTKNNLSIR